MGKNQIRRLPITDRGMLTGIISLGDVALRYGNNSNVAKSLRQISEPRGIHELRSRGPSRLLPMLMMGLAAGAVIAFTLSPKSFSSLWEQFQDSGIPEKLLDYVEEGRGRINAVVSS
jgi:hypothetical protein